MTTDEKRSPEELSKRNAFRRLVKDLNAVSSRNLGKTLFAFFFMAICQTFIISLLASPLYARFLRGDGAEVSLVLSVLLVFASFLVWALFQYGFFALLLRMVRGEYVTIGFIFLGFKKLKEALPVSLLTAFLLSALSALLITGLAFFTDIPAMLASSLTAKNDAEALQAFHFDIKAVFVFVFCLLLLVALFFLFAFIFLSAYDVKKSALQALKMNFRLLHKRRIILFRLLLLSGGRFLAIAFFSFALFALLTLTTGEKSFSLGKLVLNFIYLVNFYTAVLRMYFALPVLYEDARKPSLNVLIEDKSDSAVIDETIALLEHGTAPLEEAEAPAGESSNSGEK